MAISSEVDKITYAGNGLQLLFPFPFAIFDEEDLDVVLTDDDGTEIPLILGSDYTVTPSGRSFSSGGDVMTKGSYSPISAQQKLTIMRGLLLTQEVNYEEGDAFPAETHEEALDRLTMISQQLQEQISRCLKGRLVDDNPESLPPASERASHQLGFDANGDPIAVAGDLSAVLVSTFGETLIDDADAPTARQTLDISAANTPIADAGGHFVSTNVEDALAELLTKFSGPVGSILPFAGTSAPTGYLFCNGAAVSRSAYSDLFAVIGTAFGAGDGSTTFNLPDIRGRFLRGQDEGQGEDPDAASRTALASGGNTGDDIGSEQEDAMQRITGHVRYDAYMVSLDGVFSDGGSASAGGTAGSYTTRADFDSADSVSPNAAKTSDHETRPKNVYVRYIIKFGVPTQVGTVNSNLDQRVTDLENNPGAAPLLHVEDQKAAGTPGGTFTSGDWRTRDLNQVVVNQITGASLASNQITLPAGTYEVHARAPALSPHQHIARLQDVTNSTTLVLGCVAYNNSTANEAQTDSTVKGRFTLSAPATVELQHYGNTTQSSNGFGASPSFGVTNIFSQVWIRKVA